MTGDLIIRQGPKIVTRSMSKKGELFDIEPDQYTTIPFTAKALKLLVDEYQQQQESKMSTRKAQLDEFILEEGYDDSDEEWDDPEDFEQSYFTQDREEDPQDEEFKDDPIYQLDLKEHLLQCFKQCQQDPRFQPLIPHLTGRQIEILKGALA